MRAVLPNLSWGRSLGRPAATCRETSVETMLARGTPAASLPQPAVDQIENALEAVPSDIVRLVEHNGTRMVVLHPGQSPMEVVPDDGSSLLHPVDLPAELEALRALARSLEDAEAAVARYEQLLVQLPPEARGLILQQRDAELAGVVAQRSGGRLQLAPRSQPELPATLEDLARQHGAQSPQEVEDFVRLLQAANQGKRLETAASAAADPALATFFRELPIEKRPLLAGGRLLVPDLHYFEGRLLARPEYDWARNWRGGRWAGYYRSDINTLFLREEYLGNTAEGTSVPVHELGHAFADALHDRDPEAYARLKRARDETYVRLVAQHSGFPTRYASQDPSEFVAESFAVRFSPRPDQFPAPDPGWAGALEAALQEAPRLLKAE